MKEAKIKTIAKVIWIMGSIFSVLMSLPFFVGAGTVGRSYRTTVNGYVTVRSANGGTVFLMVILGMAAIGIGLAISYAIKVMIEAFAELCGDVYCTRRILQNKEAKESEKQMDNFFNS